MFNFFKRKNPQKGAMFLIEGDKMFTQGNFKKAIDYQTKAIKLLPDNADILENAYWSRGKAYHKLNQFEKAISDFNYAIKLNSNYLIAYASRGECYLSIKEWNKAATDFEKGLTLQYDIWHQVATEKLREIGDLQQAQVKYEMHYGASMAYNQLLQFSKCLKHLEEAFKINQSDQLLNYIIQVRKRVDYHNDNSSEPEFVALAREVNSQYERGVITNGRRLLIDIYDNVRFNPEQLKNVKDYSSLGASFLLMVDLGLSDDIDTLQMMTSVGYLCMSKAIEKEPNDLNLYKFRILLLKAGHEPFLYTVMEALDIDTNPYSVMGGMASIYARDAIYKMEIADLELNPNLYKRVPFFMQRKKEFDEMIDQKFLSTHKTRKTIIETGLENHKKVTAHLEKKILDNEDLDF